MMRLPETLNQSTPRVKKNVLIVALITVVSVPTTQAAIDESIENALKLGESDAKYGQVKFNLNYRYEYADTEQSPQDSANGNTFRLRLGYLTPQIAGIQGFAEYENVFVAQGDYLSPLGTYGDRMHQVVADPGDKHELNQLWLSFKGIPDTLIKAGRQRIKIDDDRFIGNVGWRQMEQTYDSVLVTNQSIKDVTVTTGYIGRVRNIVSLSDNMDAPFLNINYKMGEYGQAVVYGYWFDFDNVENFAKSTQTYGLRFAGSPQLNDDITLQYIAEYSYQEDYGTNKGHYGVDRYNFMGGLTALGFTVQGAVEQLDGHDGGAFSTPLGTNHKFQGWADRFLTTPATGLRDVNATLSTQAMGAKLMFVYHNFDDDTGHVKFGDEYDFQIVKNFGQHYSLLAKYAYYEGDKNAPGAFKNDTQKVWIQGGISF